MAHRSRNRRRTARLRSIASFATLALLVGGAVLALSPLLCAGAAATVLLIRATAFRGHRARRTDAEKKVLAAGAIAGGVWLAASWVLSMTSGGDEGSPALVLRGGLSLETILLVTLGSVGATTALLLAVERYRHRHRHHSRRSRSASHLPGDDAPID